MLATEAVFAMFPATLTVKKFAYTCIKYKFWNNSAVRASQYCGKRWLFAG